MKQILAAAILMAAGWSSAIGQGNENSLAKIENRQEVVNYRPMLQRALDSIGHMAPAQEYRCIEKVWENWDDEPAEGRETRYIVVDNPSDPYTNAAFVLFGKEGYSFGYDGTKRIRPLRDGKDGIFEVDYKFKHAEAPRIRVVRNPFFHEVADVLTYVLTSADSMQVQAFESRDCFDLEVTFLDSHYINFGIGQIDPHGQSKRVFHATYKIRFQKSDMLPVCLENVPNPTQISKHSVVSRKVLDIDTLDIEAYLPEGFRYANDADYKKAPQMVGIGQQCPDFKAVSTEGDTITLGQYRGKVLILVHTAIGCGACQAAVPTLMSIGQKYPHDRVEVLALDAWGEKLSAMRHYRQQKGFAYPFALEVNQENPISAKLGNATRLAPWFTLVDANGVIRHTIKGYNEKELLAEVEKLYRGK